MAHWAAPVMARQQMVLISSMLEQEIPPDHPVRLLDEILGGIDWSAWEAHYESVRGQPPVHPRVLASAILYGLSLGLRSSRQLERACLSSIDFLWLVEKRDIDHSTFCKFRTQFSKELKGLFRQVGRIAMDMDLMRLNQVSLDGTKVAANSSRHGTARAATLEQRLKCLDEQIEGMLAEAVAADGRDHQLWGEGTPNRLPRGLADLKSRQERLGKALAAARARDAAAGPKAKPAAVPVADPDSAVAPNKHGGYSPNYTPMLAVDGQAGLIVDAEVLADHDESRAVLGAVERMEENFGRKPAQALADSAFGGGGNLSALAEGQVEAYIPLEHREDSEENPARRSDPSQAIAPALWEKLPVNRRTGRLSRMCFIYDAAADQYWCPMGKALTLVGSKSKPAHVARQYRCQSCAGCPLATRCLGEKAQVRELERDVHEPLREAMDARMRSEQGRNAYRRRSWMGEYAQGILKSVMGVRQFLLRGLVKVRTEWLWCCTAFNLRKLTRAVAARRAAPASLATVQA